MTGSVLGQGWVSVGSVLGQCWDSVGSPLNRFCMGGAPLNAKLGSVCGYQIFDVRFVCRPFASPAVVARCQAYLLSRISVSRKGCFI